MIYSKINSAIDFLRSYKSGDKIAALLLKERCEEFQEGKKIAQKKEELATAGKK